MEKNLLTAEQARALRLSVDTEANSTVDEILVEVAKWAKAGELSLKIRTHGFGDSHLYYGHPTAIQQAVINKLRSLGYRVDVRVEERQLVDIWLEVHWG